MFYPATRCCVSTTFRDRETEKADGACEAHSWKHPSRSSHHQQGFEEIGRHIP